VVIIPGIFALKYLQSQVKLFTVWNEEYIPDWLSFNQQMVVRKGGYPLICIVHVIAVLN